MTDDPSPPAGSHPNPARIPGSVSVVIPCRNEAATIGSTIEALRNQTRPPDEIVVVDGASTDGTLEVLRRLQAAEGIPGGAASDAEGARGAPDPPADLASLSPPADPDAQPAPHIGVRLVVVIEPGASIPRAVNAGVRAATGNVIVRMDAHATPARDYIRLALARLAEPRAGVVGGIWEIAPGAPTTMAEAIARAVSHPLGAGDAAYRVGGRQKAARDVDTVPFGCFTRATWELLGGLDESLLTNEDYEFNHRARQRGLRVILDPAIRSTYHARPTLGALARQYYRYGWWKARMLRKHPGALRWRQAVPAGFVAGLAVLAVAGVLWRPGWWVLAGVVAGYLATLAMVSAAVCAREGGWMRFPAMIATFIVVHLAWGTGAVLSLPVTFIPGQDRG